MKNEVYTDHESLNIYSDSNHIRPDSFSLYNWVFHYNEYTTLWNAIPRDYYNDYWNNNNCEHILSSSSIETLKELIYKTSGDKEKIEKLIGEQ
jgi:hypothetical protein